MNDQQLLKAVLSLLAGAKFDARGNEIMQIAEVIHQFNQYVESRESKKAAQVQNG